MFAPENLVTRDRFDHLVPLNHSLVSLLVSIYRKSRYLEVDAARALCSDCPASTPTNALLRQEALDGVAGAAPNTLSVRPPSRPSVATVAAVAAVAAAAAAASAAADKSLVLRAHSRRTSSSDKPLVRDTAEDKLQRQARIASDRDPKRSGGSLGRGSPSGENDREASGAAADSKILKWGWGIGRVLRRFKDPNKSGGSLGRDSLSGENERSEDRTDGRATGPSLDGIGGIGGES